LYSDTALKLKLSLDY